MDKLIARAVLEGWLFDNVTNNVLADGSYGTSPSAYTVVHLLHPKRYIKIDQLKRMAKHYYIKANKVQPTAEQYMAKLEGTQDTTTEKLQAQFQLVEAAFQYRKRLLDQEAIAEELEKVEKQIQAALPLKEKRKLMEAKAQELRKQLK